MVTKLDFGPSLKQRGRQVIDIILDGMKTSAKLGLIAAFSAAIAGIVLGALAALRRNTVLDKIIMVITTAFVSMPSFIMGSFLLIVFSVKLGWVPANGATAEGLILPIITLALYPMIKSCTNSTNRYAMMHIAEDMLMNTGCIVPLYYYTDIYMLDDSVQGFFSNPLGYKYFMHCTIAK